jgi:hypothetical protein
LIANEENNKKRIAVNVRDIDDPFVIVTITILKTGGKLNILN